MATDLLINKKLKKMYEEIDYKIEKDLEKTQNSEEFDHYDILLTYKGRTIEIFYGQNKGCHEPTCYDIVMIYSDYANDAAMDLNSFCRAYNCSAKESGELRKVAKWAKNQIKYLLGEDLRLFLDEIFIKPY